MAACLQHVEAVARWSAWQRFKGGGRFQCHSLVVFASLLFVAKCLQELGFGGGTSRSTSMLKRQAGKGKARKLDVINLRKQVAIARQNGITARGLVFIDPGNPTGQCLSERNLQELVQFCFEERLMLLANEVYQVNIYQDERPLISARKVLMDMGPPYSKSVELISFHTVSKGFLGECGQRGGYYEMTNIHPQTVEELYKVASISLLPNVNGQILVGYATY